MLENLGWATENLEDDIDCDKSVNSRILCDLGRDILPFKDTSVDRLYSKQFLKHLLQEEAERLLTKLYRIWKNKSIL